MAVPGRSRSTIIVLVLAATLAMTAMLAYEVVQSARSHRATAENVLRDYARFATWEVTRLGRQQLLNTINAELGRVQTWLRRGNLEGAIGRTNPCSSCGGGYEVFSAFHTPLPNANVVFAGAPVEDGIRNVVSDALAAGMRKPEAFTCPAFRIVAGPDGLPRVVVWRPLHDRSDMPTAMIGVVADLRLVSGVFDHLVRHTPLLPPSLVPAGKGSANTALAVRVTSPEGQQLYASAGDWSAYQAGEALTKDLGALQVAVALRPDAAEKLIIGGLPRERLPLVVGLLALTAGLVVVAIVQLRREAELSRMRADFVSGVSHELRTPLAQIRMFTETLLLGRVRSPGEGRRSLEIIARETQRLIQLVENVLVFSRGERRAAQVSREALRLAPVVAEVADTFAPLADGRQATVVTALDEAVFAKADEGAIRRILLNLLDNAVKYGPAGQTIHVLLQLDGTSARITVEDEGPGIAPHDAERIWQPFKRLSRSADVTGGAGIGLAIVRQLTELHGGRSWVEPRPQGGSRFVVEIPGAWSGAGAVPAVA